MPSLLKKLSLSIKIHDVHVVKQTQKQTQTQSVWPVSKLSIESVGSRRELVANSCTHCRRWRDATKQFRRVGVGGVYWASRCCLLTSLSLLFPSHSRHFPSSQSSSSLLLCPGNGSITVFLSEPFQSATARIYPIANSSLQYCDFKFLASTDIHYVPLSVNNVYCD